jgi:exodeoxyribonuclease VII small subunit
VPECNTGVRQDRLIRSQSGITLACGGETREEERLATALRLGWVDDRRRCGGAERAHGGSMDGAEPTQDIAQMSFEDALAELEAIVRRLEEGSAKLDDAIVAYERGAALKRHCEAKLGEAQARVDRIVLGANGRAAAEAIATD